MEQTKAAIYTTLSYSDIFDFPLRKEELWKYLVGPHKVSLKAFEKVLTSMTTIRQTDEYFYLPRKKALIQMRKRRADISYKKLQRAYQAVHLLRYIPTVAFIGLSGSLAMENADEDADIDFFLITKPNTLWLTRLFALLLLEVKGMRRKRTGGTYTDTICVNMLLDTNHLSFPSVRHDAYSAHEIVQMKPLFDKNGTYHNFLSANKWVLHFLPNGFPLTKDIAAAQSSRQSILLAPFEFIARTIQIWYMRGHRTKETIEKGFVAFHPFDYKDEILHCWEKRKSVYGI